MCIRDRAFHERALCTQPLLVFEGPELPARVARLREQGVAPQPGLLRGMDRAHSALIESPDGTLLLLVGSGN